MHVLEYYCIARQICEGYRLTVLADFLKKKCYKLVCSRKMLLVALELGMDEASGGARGALAPSTAADSVELLVFFSNFRHKFIR